MNNDCKGEIKVVGNTIGKQGSSCADNHDKNKYFELNLNFLMHWKKQV